MGIEYIKHVDKIFMSSMISWYSSFHLQLLFNQILARVTL